MESPDPNEPHGGLDYASVASAASALEADGMIASVERVAAHLGLTAFADIGLHLRAWRREGCELAVAGLSAEAIELALRIEARATLGERAARSGQRAAHATAIESAQARLGAFRIAFARVHASLAAARTRLARASAALAARDAELASALAERDAAHALAAAAAERAATAEHRTVAAAEFVEIYRARALRAATDAVSRPRLVTELNTELALARMRNAALVDELGRARALEAHVRHRRDDDARTLAVAVTRRAAGRTTLTDSGPADIDPARTDPAPARGGAADAGGRPPGRGLSAAPCAAGC